MLDLLFTGRRIDAAEALRLGFVGRVVGSDALDAALGGVPARPDILRGIGAFLERRTPGDR